MRVDFAMATISWFVGSSLASSLVVVITEKRFATRLEESRQSHAVSLQDRDFALRIRERVAASDTEAVEDAWEALNAGLAVLSQRRIDLAGTEQAAMDSAGHELKKRLGGSYDLVAKYDRGVAAMTRLRSAVLTYKIAQLKRLQEGEFDGPDELNAVLFAFALVPARGAFEAFDAAARPYIRSEVDPTAD